MPTDTEIEAAAKAILRVDTQLDDWPYEGSTTEKSCREAAEAALTAAEKVREEAKPKMLYQVHAEEARTQDAPIVSDAEKRATGQPIETVHTCHTDCPCQTGGEPVSDFLEARTQPNCDRCAGSTEVQLQDDSHTPCPDCRGTGVQPETGQPKTAFEKVFDEEISEGSKQMREDFNAPSPIDATGLPIPDEAIEAAAKALWQVEWENEQYEACRKDRVEAALTAALPHLEAAIRADERAKVRERVEARRLTDGPPPFGKLDGDELVYNRAIDDALNAIDEGEQ